MLQDDILKILSGASAATKESSKMMENKIAQLIDEKVLKGKYVTREEYDKLKKLVEKLEKKL